MDNTSNRHQPGKWPFPPTPPGRETALSAVPGAYAGGLGSARGVSFAQRRQVWGDVLLVLAWGAMIPGFLWLGYAAGF